MYAYLLYVRAVHVRGGGGHMSEDIWGSVSG
jgi:hypothetical protein